jgi:hypothetical protein
LLIRSSALKEQLAIAYQDDEGDYTDDEEEEAKQKDETQPTDDDKAFKML